MPVPRRDGGPPRQEEKGIVIYEKTWARRRKAPKPIPCFASVFIYPVRRPPTSPPHLYSAKAKRLVEEEKLGGQDLGLPMDRESLQAPPPLRGREEKPLLERSAHKEEIEEVDVESHPVRKERGRGHRRVEPDVPLVQTPLYSVRPSSLRSPT